MEITIDNNIERTAKGTVLFTSLGCDKNRVDSEVMVGILQNMGYQVISDESTADVIVVNTCCFIKDALDESIETIVELADYKTEGNCKALVVTGCLGQRYADDFFQELPEVDALVGTGAYEQIGEVITDVLEKGKTHTVYMESIDHDMEEENGKLRVLSTAPYFAYLKISEGCDNHCTYCVIPKLKGKHRSRHMESLVEEAKILADIGVKELVLIAQDTSIYGRDLYGESKLHELIEELAKIDGILWIRLLYCYPETITDALIQTMKNTPKVCHYLDMPIQHGSTSVLRRMGRKTNQEQIKEKIMALRNAMPDIALRTTVITGFPGETEAEFQELLDFVAEMKFDRLGAFSYSQEDDTPAALMDNQIDDEVKEERRDEVLELQKGVAAALCEKEVGKQLEVLIEGRLPDENIYCGRTKRDAPDIDGLVFVHAEEEIVSGEFVTVKIEEALDYDLIGKVIYDE
ncbi:MAG: 30S ribosomal protein S12 methylthiotransferase RimO [Bacillota bacterium]